MRTIRFTVDAALLRELGERLVGRPYIALAELVKNSYDADATEVELRFGRDTIAVVDNGSGMTFEEFRDFWMRIGSPHKEARSTSDVYGRPLTGSKGVGRLAVQLLANQLAMHTVHRNNVNEELVANVVWSEAIASKDLTTATAKWTRQAARTNFPEGSAHGTKIALTQLQHKWTSDAFTLLARELWTLQPPFDVGDTPEGTFNITLVHPSRAAIEKFERQMRAVLDLWSARVLGKLQPRTEGDGDDRVLRVVVQFRDGKHSRADHVIKDCALDDVQYEVRVFSLRYRQPHGISVTEARDYLRRYGGVGVYDAGFRLPYYGADSDWLNIARDAGRRLSRSELLPDALQVTEGLQYLPTNERLFGIVNVNTSNERRAAQVRGRTRDALAIQVTRDRLADTPAYRNLVESVRFGIDLYANEEAARAYERSQAARPVAPLRERADRLEDVLERYANDVPAAVRTKLKRELDAILEASRAEAEGLTRQSALLGALATAGISTVAYEHEATKQLVALEEIAQRLRQDRLTAPERRGLADEVESWVRQARATRTLFSHLVDQEQREERSRLRARRVVERVGAQVRVLAPDLDLLTNDVPDEFRLPPGSMAEWAAIFQNLFFNAVNAMLDTAHPIIHVRSLIEDEHRELLIEDTGVGVELSTSEELFRPFLRRQVLSRERQRLGVGGTGLGLTIVRMVARQLHVSVHFVAPAAGYSTAMQLAWDEED